MPRADSTDLWRTRQTPNRWLWRRSRRVGRPFSRCGGPVRVQEKEGIPPKCHTSGPLYGPPAGSRPNATRGAWQVPAQMPQAALGRSPPKCHWQPQRNRPRPNATPTRVTRERPASRGTFRGWQRRFSAHLQALDYLQQMRQRAGEHGPVAVAARGVLLGHLAAAGGAQFVELPRRRLVFGAHPRVAHQRHPATLLLRKQGGSGGPLRVRAEGSAAGGFCQVTLVS
jgi:hypothetical protein